MNDMFTFEPSAWELFENTLKSGSVLPATRFLAVAGQEEDSLLEEAFQGLLEKHVTLDISDLPQDFGSGELEGRLRREALIASAGDLIHELEEGDPLRLYLEELARIPAQGDPALLIQLLKEHRQDVSEKLLKLHLYRVVDAAKQHTGRGVLLMDLIQEGSLGLWQGILHYKTGDFLEHIDWWIGQSLARVIILQAKQSGVARTMEEAMEQYRRADRLLLDRLGRNATLEEIALEMGTTPEQAELARDMLQAARDMEAVKKPKPTEEPEDQMAVEDTAYFQSRQRTAELLSSLDELEAKILIARFGLEGGAPETPQSIGARLNMTAEAVVTMEAAALEKLRNG